MKKREILIWVFLGILFCGISVFAAPIEVQIDHAQAQGDFSLGIGSHLTFKIPGDRKTHSGQFLGKLVNPDGTVASAMIVDENLDKAYYVAPSDLKGLSLTARAQPVLKQYDQIDGTCTGYAIDHYMQQMRLLGFENKKLDTTLSDEKGRSQLLVESINNYYLVTQHQFSIKGIMNQFGTRFEFKCEMKVFQDAKPAIDWMNERLKRQVPVMVSFNVGTQMSPSSIRLYEYPKKRAGDNRIWTPRKTGDRNSGGHSVVAVQSFEVRGKEKVIMLDSDWDAPRIWDASDVLGGETAIDEVEFYSCE